MNYVIKNSHLIVVISDLGAELQSIQMINDSVELLWQLNKEIWERQAPLLFPIIGRLKDEEYIYNDITYKIPIHGFAYTSNFKVKEQFKDQITFSLTNNDKTMGMYPFKYNLLITYILNGNKLVKQHTIENLSKDKMYFELGGHEGYNLSLFTGEKMEDYYLEFMDQNNLLTYTADENVMIEKKKNKISLDNKKLYLSPEVFKNDALIIDNLKVREVTLKNTKNPYVVKVTFEDFKYLGIWTKYMRSNYVCIEPWSSLPDANYLDKQLTNKQDIILLQSKEKKVLTYTMSFYKEEV
ncbi:MAG: aldose 1-epimerase family protein [Clostridiales bacterium]|nr:aldose 1-epimerase family protein [Clostridiales bacterium]